MNRTILILTLFLFSSFVFYEEYKTHNYLQYHNYPHLEKNHIGKSETWLKNRLDKRAHISASSSFYNKEEAERLIFHAIKYNQIIIQKWLKDKASPDRKVISFDFNEDIGYGFVRGEPKVIKMNSILVVLVKKDRGYKILTAYPIHK